MPKYLQRIEEVIEPEETSCACGTERHVIGEDISERLDVIPAHFRVIATRPVWRSPTPLEDPANMPTTS